MEFKRFTNLVFSIVFLVFFFGCATDPATPNRQLSMSGDVSAAYDNGRFVVWTPKADATKSNSSGMVSAMSTSTAISDTSARPSIRDTIDIIVEGPIAKDGTFAVDTTVSDIRPVYFYILDATSEDGVLLAPTKGQQFILEPGKLTLTMDRFRKFVVTGGQFNDAVFNSWKTSADFKTAQTDYYASFIEPENESKEDSKIRLQRISELSNTMLDLESEGRRQIALNHEDPKVRKLVLQSTWLIDSWFHEAVLALDELLPDDPWVDEALAQAEVRAQSAKEREKFAIGKTVIDFAATTLTGEEVKLTEFIEGKSLVLLEFWASWCGPCRVEIPHMKEAYERFKDKGFEIISFTIDDLHEDWELASSEEDLPWLNWGMGPEADAPMAYSVVGVPNNYLFDARTMTIIARDLRGPALDQALADELL